MCEQNLSVREFARRFGISTVMLYKCWREGCGPQSFKVGKRRLIPASELEAWRETLIDIVGEAAEDHRVT